MIDVTVNCNPRLTTSTVRRREASFWHAVEFPGLKFAAFKNTRDTYPPHPCDAYAFVLVQEGMIGVAYRGTEHIVCAGNLVAFQPGEVRATRPIAKSCSYLIALIKVPLLLELASEIAPERPRRLYLPEIFLPGSCTLYFRNLCDSFQYVASMLERESRLLLFVADLLPHTLVRAPSVARELRAVTPVKEA